jgi:hypothetical protein
MGSNNSKRKKLSCFNVPMEIETDTSSFSADPITMKTEDECGFVVVNVVNTETITKPMDNPLIIMNKIEEEKEHEIMKDFCDVFNGECAHEIL